MLSVKGSLMDNTVIVSILLYKPLAATKKNNPLLNQYVAATKKSKYSAITLISIIYLDY